MADPYRINVIYDQIKHLNTSELLDKLEAIFDQIDSHQRETLRILTIYSIIERLKELEKSTERLYVGDQVDWTKTPAGKFLKDRHSDRYYWTTDGPCCKKCDAILEVFTSFRIYPETGCGFRVGQCIAHNQNQEDKI